MFQSLLFVELSELVIESNDKLCSVEAMFVLQLFLLWLLYPMLPIELNGDACVCAKQKLVKATIMIMMLVIFFMVRKYILFLVNV